MSYKFCSKEGERFGVSLRIDWKPVSSSNFMDHGYFGNDRKFGECSEVKHANEFAVN